MNRLKRIGTSVAVLVAALLFGAAAPAFATHGANDSRGGDAMASATATVSDDTTTTTTTSHAEARQDGHKLTDAEHQKRCESHKQGLTTKFSHIVTNSQRIQDRISDVLDKAVAYQQTNNITVANFDNLVAAANTAKANSADAIANLKAVQPSLDCNNTSVHSDVSVFKTAAAKTRDSLKAYRTAVKAVVQSLKTAKTGAEGSNQ